MSLSAIFNGAPTGVPSPGGAADGVDTSTGAAWFALAKGAGWQPQAGASIQNTQLGLSAEFANIVFTPAVTGLYRFDAYSISTVATSGTLPAFNISYTEGETGNAFSGVALLADKASAAANVINYGTAVYNIQAGTTVTISGASYASTTYNNKLRVSFIG